MTTNSGKVHRVCGLAEKADEIDYPTSYPDQAQ
jgi:hypothetical protein